MLFATFVANIAAESNMTFSCINIEKGLNSNTVHCVFQDSNGMMWFGTNDGLSCYDTYQLRTWRNEPGNPDSIGNNSIYCIIEDKEQNLWIGTERGLYVYDKRCDSFHSISPDNRIANSHIRSLTQDRNGYIWAATLGYGVFRIHPETYSLSNWTHSDDKESIGSDYSTKVLADDLGNIWCLTSDSNLYIYEASKDNFRSIPITDIKKGTTIRNAFNMCTDWEGNLWITGWDCGIFHYNKESGVFTNHLTRWGRPILSGRIHTITEPEQGILLIGSDEGITSLNYTTGAYETTSYSPSEYNGLSDGFVHDICIDKEGGLWIATYFGGVNYMNPNSRSFILGKCIKDAEKGRIISKFCENGDGRIWIGTDDGGLFLYDPQKKNSLKVTVDKNIPNLNIHGLLKDGNSLWVGTYSNGLYRMNLKGGRTEHYRRFTPENTTDQSIYSLHKGPTGKLWIGTKTGIWSWSENEGFKNILKLGYHSDVIEICSDSKGNIWFASISKGLIRFDPKTQTTDFIETSNEQPVIPNEILSMCINKDYLYIGTSGRGVIRYDIGTGKTAQLYSSSCNMLNISAFHIINDENDIWISSNEGLIRYNINTGEAAVFGKADGLRTDLFNNNSGFKASDGRIYLGTNDGFNVFDPEAIQINLTAPSTTFTQCSFPNLRDGDHITIRKGHDPFTIGFAGLSYRSPQKNRYRYMMEGRDDQWNEISWNENKVQFSGLKCRTYTFKVCSCNNDGVWGDPISATITVKPYWWNSKAAIILYIVFGVLLISAIILIFVNYSLQKKSTRAQNIKHVKEKTRIETELQFFTNLAHEIRTPVMLINDPAKEIASINGLPKKVTDNIHIIQKSADKLANLMNEIIYFRQSSEMNLIPMPISGLTHKITSELVPGIKRNGIEFRIVDSTDGQAVVMINPEAWGKVLNNLISNAIQFAKNQIEIRINLVGNKIKVSVYDNGAGIPPGDLKKIFNAFWHYNKAAVRPSTGFGLGLSIANLLIHKMGMSMKVKSVQDNYTEFIISIPLSDSEFVEDESTEIEENHIISSIKNTEKPVANQEKGLEIPTSHKNGGTLMIVDDDDELRLYLASVLSETYNILTASDGEEALQILRDGQMADIIVSDVAMPKLNGIELCNNIRQDLNFCHIPIILLSADSDMETRLKSAENGADAYIDKPVDISYLKTQIKNVLERRRLLWDSFSKRPFLALTGITEKDMGDSFLKQFSDLILKNMAKQDLSVNDLADEMHVSRSVLFKKVKDMTGMTPNNFIKTMRLRKAAELLSTDRYKINEVCWLVGFNTPSYFSKCFHEQFGIYPKEFSTRHWDIEDDEEE